MSMNDCVMNSTSVSNEITTPDNLLNCNLSINANSLCENFQQLHPSNVSQHEECGIENVADCSLQSDMSMNDCLMNSTSVNNENTAPDNLLNSNLSINANSLCENLFSEEENSTFCYLQFQVLVN
jgi:hypothetical protein